MDLTLGKRLRELPGPIMVTGHSGFKGTWLTFLLEKLKISVVGYSLPPEKDSLFARSDRVGAIPETFAEIRDQQSVKRFMEEHKPSVVIHLAAQPIVLQSYKSPLDTFEINVIGTANILNSAFATNSVRVVGVVTTDKVYRNDNSGHAFVESDPLEGKDPYSASKVGTESVVAAWQQMKKQFEGPQVISLRAGNVIGGGDWASDRLIPDLLRAFIAKSEVVLRNPESTRPWQHVLDPLVGYLMAIERALEGEGIAAFNFGPDSKSLSVKKVAEISSKVWPYQSEIHGSQGNSEKTLESISLELDSTLAREKLNWSPTWSQEEAVISTINWWDKVLNDGVSPIIACGNDIDFIFKSLPIET
jgi:CDP-glucose 4,6-dehydratase